MLTLLARKLSARILPVSALVLTTCMLLPLSGCGWLSGSSKQTTTVRLTADPSSIQGGASSTLTVTAANANSVTLTGSDGSSYTIPSGGGSQSVSPKATTTYTATATGSSGTVTAQATVTVQTVAAPTVTMTASPTSIDQGSSATLTVTATNATSISIAGSDGTSYTMAATGGTQTVSPTATTTYVATASGPGLAAGQSVTATATVTVVQVGPPTVTIAASPTSVANGNTSTLTVVATNATSVTIAGSDGSSYTLAATGGTQTVTPTTTTTYTATATGTGGSVTATATVDVVGTGTINSISHVIFMMQENRSFDTYFGMLDPYRDANGWNMANGVLTEVDGITTPDGSGSTTVRPFSNQADNSGGTTGQTFPLFKFTSTCIDDMSSAWLESYGDVNRYDFSTTRSINMDGFVHNAEGFDNSCATSGSCSGGKAAFTDSTGERAMGYYDQGFLNYYYYMASQFAVSDRWFSPVSSKTVDNRIATLTGGTTQGLTRDPGSDDHLGQLDANTIFAELDKAGVSWKIYYTVTQGDCVADDECSGGATGNFPASEFEDFTYSVKYVYANKSGNPANCTAPTQPSSVVGDSSNSFCIDPTHIAPISDPTYGFFADLKNNTLPAFSYIEPGFAHNDEHPGYQGNILTGQQQVASIINAFMNSPEWGSSVFFLAYDEGGGPYDHVPPVPGHSNDYTDATVGSTAVANIPDISSIAVNPDNYYPCLPANGTPAWVGSGNQGYCDLESGDPGTNAGNPSTNTPPDAAYQYGFAAQLGFRVPNLIISPFTIAHYVGHNPMDHTAVIKFVESRFIGPNANLTKRDAAQPNLLDFFDFANPPWATPPTPPAPVTSKSGDCDPEHYGGGS